MIHQPGGRLRRCEALEWAPGHEEARHVSVRRLRAAEPLG